MTPIEVGEVMTPVLLTNISLDKSIQCRASIRRDLVDEYSTRMQNGDVFPPVDLYGTENECWIGDGWHRVLAAFAGDTRHGCIEANLHPGGRIDALRHALGANAIHGQRRSTADKRRAVEIAVCEFPKLSNAAIATLCGVDDKTVAAHRPGTSGNSEPETRTGQDGKQYPVKSRRTLARRAKLKRWRRESRAAIQASALGAAPPESVPQPPADDHHDQDDPREPERLVEPADAPAGDTEATPAQTLDQRPAMLFAGQAIFALEQIEDDDVDLEEALHSVVMYANGRRGF